MKPFLYQTVSVNRNSRELRAVIFEFLKINWLWTEDDFNEGMRQTRYSISFELMNDDVKQLATDVKELKAFIDSVTTTGKTYVSAISKNPIFND